jgi:hypothetical protein
MFTVSGSQQGCEQAKQTSRIVVEQSRTEWMAGRDMGPATIYYLGKQQQQQQEQQQDSLAEWAVYYAAQAAASTAATVRISATQSAIRVRSCNPSSPGRIHHEQFQVRILLRRRSRSYYYGVRGRPQLVRPIRMASIPLVSRQHQRPLQRTHLRQHLWLPCTCCTATRASSVDRGPSATDSREKPAGERYRICRHG